MDKLELKIPPALVMLACAGFAWLIREALPNLTLTMPVQKYLAWALWIPGAVLLASGALQFVRVRTTTDPRHASKASTLVTGGMYRITRNPMYLGMLLWLAGFVLLLWNVGAILALPAFVAYINRFQIEPEERALGARFGDDFLAFQQRTRRWI